MPNAYPVLYRIGVTPWEANRDDGPLTEVLATRPSGRALDAGCGTGRHGHAALALADGRRLREDDLLAPDPLRRLLQWTGWWLARHDDGPDRFLAVAERVSPWP